MMSLLIAGALKKCDNDPHVIMSVARIFEKDRKIDKARKWFERAVALNPRLGDAWAYYYVFEIRQEVSNKESSSEAAAMSERVLQRCEQSEPNRGELWCAITKTTTLRRVDVKTKLKRVAEQLLSTNTSNAT